MPQSLFASSKVKFHTFDNRLITVDWVCQHFNEGTRKQYRRGVPRQYGQEVKYAHDVTLRLRPDVLCPGLF